MLTYDDILAQMWAEIGAVYNGNVSAFAEAVGINRPQLTKYLRGERDMGAERLLKCIAAFGITEAEFMRRARVRAAGSPTGDEPVPARSVVE